MSEHPLSRSAILAPFACRPEETRGRLHAEPESGTRSPFQRDRDRIIHSAAFRRLQYKTQVFVYHEGDNFRTRLTHSLEVSQIARSIARVLGLEEDLAESLALAHDLGHTPFGHAGEDALQDVLAQFGGFDHNAQSLRVVTKLERRYIQFDGLNLTWETLEGLVKHNGPLTGPLAAPREDDLPGAITEYVGRHDLELKSYASAEAQAAALSDDIAYNNHDIDDGLRAGLFTIKDLADVPLVGPVFHAVIKEHPDADFSLHIHEAVRRMIGMMIIDCIDETRRRVAEFKPRSAGDVRSLKVPLVSFSDAMRANDRALKKFLFPNMYRHFTVNRMTSKGRRVVKDLFTLLFAEPGCLPPEWRRLTDGAGTAKTARVVADYIAGMTDRFALDEHRRLFDMQEKP
ncbi:deoxyguanosinetriphosphate triphosphohydrolase [Magnetospirillum sulfuroxidans]|uniref:Deoxyguanosinetriphosphate triphosphohydrolase-like protein n=1 Tax=Magnetospirillum sulfuroxidans TaxID=611300 RepID=A0ABS5I7Q7_9PROT|nr:deoxyguanosinetriphosphate triphosphohydrolase [Magnetospirillum sulfuroxidans]MBR9970466.1 deoxyguanosinetriphosphate triphosphohydrolase [Magnetospirillum sulfuroxidans]